MFGANLITLYDRGNESGIDGFKARVDFWK